MYTDKAYLVKDRFLEEAPQGSLSTFYRQNQAALDGESTVDLDVYPTSFGVQAIPGCPIGLEPLHNLSRMYLIKRLEALESDTFGVYKAELINEEGNRIFLFSEILSHSSGEVIRYGLHGGKKLKGKVCVGVINYAGIQVFEVYGDPEKVIRVGPSSAVWGEIQVVPGAVWDELKLACCKKKGSTDAGIRVIVLKKDNRAMGNIDPKCAFKHVYTLEGPVYGGFGHMDNNFLYKKSFDLKIYAKDVLEDAAKTNSKQGDEGKSNRNSDVAPIGRFCSAELHEKLQCHLPMLEITQPIDIYDKITNKQKLREKKQLPTPNKANKMGGIARAESFIRILILGLMLQQPSPGTGEENEESNEVLDALLKDDIFSILGLQENSTCLLITDKAYMDQFSGEKNFGEPCELRGDESKRAEYCKLYIENSNNACLVPTHLTCDPIIKRCVCSDDTNIIPAIHFQFGTDDSEAQTLENGRCFIRPTFQTIEGIECSPGSSMNKTFGEDEKEVFYCACENQNSPDYLNTSNPDWWRCRGSLLKSQGGILSLVLTVSAALLFAI
ncbi:hypothetical protein Ocin01_12159 [Orchesella cincta]|uniref:Uncharacterized protein n=1 Tax=Orchesella cincta TaxID=48709 RepID=A0A1D2MNC9_ORCCI|nr:hypothetical protein Ocin01_12159 [Orchesella cincta]